jgi:hypothetical protein
MGAGLLAVKSGFILFIKSYQFPLQINTLERERERETERRRQRERERQVIFPLYDPISGIEGLPPAGLHRWMKVHRKLFSLPVNADQEAGVFTIDLGLLLSKCERVSFCFKYSFPLPQLHQRK